MYSIVAIFLVIFLIWIFPEFNSLKILKLQIILNPSYKYECEKFASNEKKLIYK